MLVIIDNYDSFTYNLVQYFGELQPEYPNLLREIKVFRNDRIDIDGLMAITPDLMVISPGPCTPEESGVSLAAIEHFSGRIPVLGICLGHQCIAAVFGGKIIRAPVPVHGKFSQIRHNGRGLFRGLPQPLTAVRYHSLIVAEEGFPKELAITAHTDEGLIMGVAHREHLTFGLQFHPESYFTACGKDLLRNFVEQARGAPVGRAATGNRQ
ncbi:MAG TPA: aminodeoxychorismate/anthranilate synthase component II [Bacillota bacterium]